MKYFDSLKALLYLRRSRKGAWIEIAAVAFCSATSAVAPVRERGLKCQNGRWSENDEGRSRKGAWIEMSIIVFYTCFAVVAPVRERGLKFWLAVAGQAVPWSLP